MEIGRSLNKKCLLILAIKGCLINLLQYIRQTKNEKEVKKKMDIPYLTRVSNLTDKCKTHKY